VLDHAVDGVGDKDGSDNLVADGGDGDTDLEIGISECLHDMKNRGKSCLQSA
jgi:hypothetical protein